MIGRLLLVLAALAILFGSIFGWKAYQANQAQARLASAKPPPITVSSTRVETASWPNRLRAVGSLRAFQGVEVSAEVSGLISEIRFESGQRTEAGTLLLQLDDDAERAELRSLEAQLRLARLDYERAKGLQQRTALSQAQLDRAKSVMDSLAAQAEAQQAAIAKKAIRAPFTGELGIRAVNIGEYLSAGATIVTLQRLTPIYADFTLPERYLEQLDVEQRVEVEVAAFPGRPFGGRITAISPKVDIDTRNLVLQATLDNDARLLRPGMFARVFVYVGGDDRVLTLPRTAVNFFPYGDAVFRIIDAGDDRIVERHQVTTGRIQDGRVEIVEGLTADEEVVATGQLKLRSGQRVRIDNSIVLPAGATRG